VFVVKNTGERISVSSWYNGYIQNQLGTVEFADGTVWTREQINAMSPLFNGTDGNDTINGYGTNDTIYGGAGNDIINGGDGNDIITGGTGDDTLTGGSGKDTYIWNPGDGNDLIIDHMGYKPAEWYGTLVLGEGVSPSDIEITREGNNLAFVVTSTGERISVSSWYNGYIQNQLGTVEFADGTVWTREQINAMPLAPLAAPMAQSAASFSFAQLEIEVATARLYFDTESGFGEAGRGQEDYAGASSRNAVSDLFLLRSPGGYTVTQEGNRG
jgi:Ca2+-binding RTX toxin-like protein